MSMWSHFLRHMFGQKTYENIRAAAIALAADQLRIQEPWLRARLIKAGLKPTDAIVVSGEIVERIIAAIEK